ncbi:hypothetical protein CDL12_11007 [Handroanthus impetiginosus]|uniref:Cystatin domain-containing protein n=1 Tax=Handroanthus impetiginosus TaxID=429701 RepID=A0A2G9HFN8_9LAMI|nr:hypothetical protein CDL12_11007 [Handroanthus impetiginosus]
MAKKTIPFLLFLLPLLLTPLISTPATAVGGKVGGRRVVKNVKSNKEVQDLGRYCFQEYNRQQKINGSVSAAKLLVFSEVVEAETQVVSGIKYYLKISAATRRGGRAKIFDAVVVVKPWMHSKELLNFTPSPSPQNTK